MKLALHPVTFDPPGGTAAIAPALASMLDWADDVGVHSFWPMDHFFQIGLAGPPEDPMLEGWATIAWAAGRTRRLEFGTLVSGVQYRHPGVLAKYATTLDVLSGGRVWFGVGAGWNEVESRGLGVPMPPLAERFERLEETVRIARQMFAGDQAPFEGRHYRLERPLNMPAPLRRPPILIGGAGERKTLRLVAEYADASNFGVREDVAHKLDVLRQRCDEVGRPYDDIVKTVARMIDSPPNVPELVASCAALAELGVDMMIVTMPGYADKATCDALTDVLRQIEPLGRPTPALLGGPS
jgi:F420-dependent oxidoreductase-like protein